MGISVLELGIRNCVLRMGLRSLGFNLRGSLPLGVGGAVVGDEKLVMGVEGLTAGGRGGDRVGDRSDSLGGLSFFL